MSKQNKGHTILVVDDQENWRKALSSVLRKAGYMVETAGTLQSARRSLARGTYSVIVMDVRLVDAQTDDVSGLELLSETQDVWNETERPGLIIITGYPTEGIEPLALEKYKANHFISKSPEVGFSVERFRELVNGLI